MKELILWLRVILNPCFWFSNGRVDWKFDAALRHDLHHFGVEEANQFRCVVNGMEIWIANYPYGSGELRGAGGLFVGTGRYCSRRTRILLDEAVSEFIMRRDRKATVSAKVVRIK